MKKLIKVTLFFALIGSVIVACEKENLEANEQTQTKNTTINNKQNPDDCSNRSLNLEAEARSIDPINLDDAYAVESNVLENSSQGIEYQENYYELSEYAIDNGYIVSEFSLHYDGAVAGNEAGSVIINGNNSDEVFTDSRYLDLMAVINFYEGESNPSDIDDILASLKADLIANKNKTRGEVLDFVND